MAVHLPSELELARRARGWTQDDLAARAGVSRALVAMCQRGYHPSAETQCALADALGVERATLWPSERVAA